MYVMKLGERLDTLADDYLQFHEQLGIRWAMFRLWDTVMSEPGSRGVVKADAIAEVQKKCRAYGIEPYCFLLPQGRNTQYWHARFGQSPEADGEIENVCESLRVLGGAGIQVCEWTWSVPDVFGRIPWPTTTGRGGAGVSRFDYDLVADKRPEFAVDMSAEQMWDNLIYFMEKILPVAEQAGVRMAMHHHDPPTRWLAGEARILSSFEGMKRMIEEVDSPMNGFNICQGTVAEQAGTDVLAVIRYFGERDRINHVHFRNVKGSVPVFDESFIDDGDVDMYQAMKIYRETGYQHLFMSDHCPRMVEVDGHPTALASRAYAVGYIRALMHAVETEYAAEKARMAQREGKLVG
jgi:mannonate dehydratase